MGERAHNEASQKKIQTSPVLSLIGRAVMFRVYSWVTTPFNDRARLINFFSYQDQ
jgi:hypothetical protein